MNNIEIAKLYTEEEVRNIALNLCATQNVLLKKGKFLDHDKILDDLIKYYNKRKVK